MTPKKPFEIIGSGSDGNEETKIIGEKRTI